MRIQWGYNGYHGYLTNDNPVGGLAALNFPDRQNPFGRKLLTWNGVKLGNRFRFWQVQMLCQWQDSAVIWFIVYIYICFVGFSSSKQRFNHELAGCVL